MGTRLLKKVRVAILAALLAAGGGVAAWLLWFHDQPVHHFQVVRAGRLYRGAQPNAEKLDRIIRRYGIRTVVNLRGPAPSEPWYGQEQELCRRRGVRMIDVRVNSDEHAVPGLQQFLAVAADERAGPVYVHCEYGRARTGFAAAAYRIVFDKWTYERAMAEALALGFNPSRPLNQAYQGILQELARGTDWRAMAVPDSASPTAASTAPASRRP